MPDPTDFGERALSTAHEILRRGQETAKRETRIIRLQTQISRLRSQRQRMFLQMGQKVFDLFERDLVKNQDLRMMCQQIRSLDAEVQMKREEIAQLRSPDVKSERGVDSEEAADDIIDYEDEGLP